MCHRMLFGTPGTMANLQLKNNVIAPLHGQNQNTVCISIFFNF